MLLRLLPLPTPSAPAPPTILFTLPSPTASSSSSSSSSSPYNPYTPHHLPAPPALLSHHQTCKLNNLPCPTLLTGESSSWISTIVQEVTFLPALGEIQILLVDGSGVVMPLREAGAGKVLDEVRDHVLESGRLMEKGAASAAAERVERARESVRPTLKKGESMLMSLLGPLLSPKKEETMEVASAVQQQSVVGRELSARQHRRLARSSLVDCYRRWVLTGLKALLPPTYILFTSQSIIQTHSQTLTKTESELRVLLSISGHPTTPPASPTFSPSSRSTSPSPHPSPKSSLPFPPSAALPTHLRNTYATHLSSHVETQSSIVALEKLVRKHEREERRNRWEDSLVAIEKKHRAAPSPLVAVGSPLQQSWGLASPSSSSEDGNGGVPPLSPTSSLWSNSSYSSSSEESSEEEEEGEEPVKVVQEHEHEDYSYRREDVVAIKALPPRRRSSAGFAGVESAEGEVVRGLGF